MTELLALKSSDDVTLNIPVKKAKPSNARANTNWSMGNEYLDRVTETAFNYSDSLETVITAIKNAYETGHKAVADIQHAYMIGAIVKYLRRANTKGDGKITQDYITQAEVILGKKNLTKAVTSPTDEHRSAEHQAMYQAASMAWSRLKDRAELPKDTRGAHNHPQNVKNGATKEGLSPKDLKLDKIETELDGKAALASIAGLMAKLQEKHAKAFNKDMLAAMDCFREFVATLYVKEKELA